MIRDHIHVLPVSDWNFTDLKVVRVCIVIAMKLAEPDFLPWGLASIVVPAVILICIVIIESAVILRMSKVLLGDVSKIDVSFCGWWLSTDDSCNCYK